jgi:hypothetical protein
MRIADQASRIIHPDLPPGSFKFRQVELEKITRELREKYRDELQNASWWKAALVRIRIAHEASRIFHGRLYVAPSKR